jgi:hypothetical protein
MCFASPTRESTSGRGVLHQFLPRVEEIHATLDSGTIGWSMTSKSKRGGALHAGNRSFDEL